LSLLQSDVVKAKNLVDRKNMESEHWESEFLRSQSVLQQLESKEDKNRRTIKELSQQLVHLRETINLPATSVAAATETFSAIQRDLETKTVELDVHN